MHKSKSHCGFQYQYSAWSLEACLHLRCPCTKHMSTMRLDAFRADGNRLLTLTVYVNVFPQLHNSQPRAAIRLLSWTSPSGQKAPRGILRQAGGRYWWRHAL